MDDSKVAEAGMETEAEQTKPLPRLEQPTSSSNEAQHCIDIGTSADLKSNSGNQTEKNDSNDAEVKFHDSGNLDEGDKMTTAAITIPLPGPLLAPTFEAKEEESSNTRVAAAGAKDKTYRYTSACESSGLAVSGTNQLVGACYLLGVLLGLAHSDHLPLGQFLDLSASGNAGVWATCALYAALPAVLESGHAKARDKEWIRGTTQRSTLAFARAAQRVVETWSRRPNGPIIGADVLQKYRLGLWLILLGHYIIACCLFLALCLWLREVLLLVNFLTGLSLENYRSEEVEWWWLSWAGLFLTGVIVWMLLQGRHIGNCLLQFIILLSSRLLVGCLSAIFLYLALLGLAHVAQHILADNLALMFGFVVLLTCIGCVQAAALFRTTTKKVLLLLARLATFALSGLAAACIVALQDSDWYLTGCWIAAGVFLVAWQVLLCRASYETLLRHGTKFWAQVLFVTGDACDAGLCDLRGLPDLHLASWTTGLWRGNAWFDVVHSKQRDSDVDSTVYLPHAGKRSLSQRLGLAETMAAVTMGVDLPLDMLFPLMRISSYWLPLRSVPDAKKRYAASTMMAIWSMVLPFAGHYLVHTTSAATPTAMAAVALLSVLLALLPVCLGYYVSSVRNVMLATPFWRLVYDACGPPALGMRSVFYDEGAIKLDLVPTSDGPTDTSLLFDQLGLLRLLREERMLLIAVNSSLSKTEAATALRSCFAAAQALDYVSRRPLQIDEVGQGVWHVSFFYYQHPHHTSHANCFLFMGRPVSGDTDNHRAIVTVAQADELLQAGQSAVQTSLLGCANGPRSLFAPVIEVELTAHERRIQALERNQDDLVGAQLRDAIVLRQSLDMLKPLDCARTAQLYTIDPSLAQQQHDSRLEKKLVLLYRPEFMQSPSVAADKMRRDLVIWPMIRAELRHYFGAHSPNMFLLQPTAVCRILDDVHPLMRFDSHDHKMTLLEAQKEDHGQGEIGLVFAHDLLPVSDDDDDKKEASLTTTTTTTTTSARTRTVQFLFSYLPRRPASLPSLDCVLRVCHDLLWQLDLLHKLGFAHGSINCQAVLLRIEGDAKKAAASNQVSATVEPDKILRASLVQMHAAEFCGTMSEHGNKWEEEERARLLRRNDVRQLGLVFYELVSGDTLYDLEREPSKLVQLALQLHESRSIPEHLAPLRSLIVAMLNKDKDETADLPLTADQLLGRVQYFRRHVYDRRRECCRCCCCLGCRDVCLDKSAACSTSTCCLPNGVV